MAVALRTSHEMFRQVRVLNRDKLGNIALSFVFIQKPKLCINMKQLSKLMFVEHSPGAVGSARYTLHVPVFITSVFPSPFADEQT